jgi:hypothetical protein
MVQNRSLWVVLTVVVGLLQAWDSGALRAGPAAQVAMALGIAVPAVALALTEKWAVWVAALIAGAVLLTIARLTSLVSLNALHIALMVPAMYIFFVCRWQEMAGAKQA